jgi:hypothetical protein
MIDNLAFRTRAARRKRTALAGAKRFPYAGPAT